MAAKTLVYENVAFNIGEVPGRDRDNTETESWLIRVREGDASAFDQLFNRYYHRVIGYIRNYVDESDLEDVAQEIFINVFRRIDSIQSLKAFEAYLYRAAKNRSINWLKKRIRVRKLLKILCYASNEWNQSDMKSHTEPFDALKQLIKQIPLESRRFIELFYLEKRSREEIANQLNISTSTAYRHIAEARAQLLEIAEKNQIVISFEGRHTIHIHDKKDKDLKDQAE